MHRDELWASLPLRERCEFIFPFTIHTCFDPEYNSIFFYLLWLAFWIFRNIPSFFWWTLVVYHCPKLVRTNTPVIATQVLFFLVLHVSPRIWSDKFDRSRYLVEAFFTDMQRLWWLLTSPNVWHAMTYIPGIISQMGVYAHDYLHANLDCGNIYPETTDQNDQLDLVEFPGEAFMKRLLAEERERQGLKRESQRQIAESEATREPEPPSEAKSSSQPKPVRNQDPEFSDSALCAIFRRKGEFPYSIRKHQPQQTPPGTPELFRIRNRSHEPDFVGGKKIITYYSRGSQTEEATPRAMPAAYTSHGTQAKTTDLATKPTEVKASPHSRNPETRASNFERLPANRRWLPQRPKAPEVTPEKKIVPKLIEEVKANPKTPGDSEVAPKEIKLPPSSLASQPSSPTPNKTLAPITTRQPRTQVPVAEEAGESSREPAARPSLLSRIRMGFGRQPPSPPSPSSPHSPRSPRSPHSPNRTLNPQLGARKPNQRRNTRFKKETDPRVAEALLKSIESSSDSPKLDKPLAFTQQENEEAQQVGKADKKNDDWYPAWDAIGKVPEPATEARGFPDPGGFENLDNYLDYCYDQEPFTAQADVFLRLDELAAEGIRELNINADTLLPDSHPAAPEDQPSMGEAMEIDTEDLYSVCAGSDRKEDGLGRHSNQQTNMDLVPSDSALQQLPDVGQSSSSSSSSDVVMQEPDENVAAIPGTEDAEMEEHIVQEENAQKENVEEDELMVSRSSPSRIEDPVVNVPASNTEQYQEVNDKLRQHIAQQEDHDMFGSGQGELEPVTHTTEENSTLEQNQAGSGEPAAAEIDPQAPNSPSLPFSPLERTPVEGTPIIGAEEPAAASSLSRNDPPYISNEMTQEEMDQVEQDLKLLLGEESDASTAQDEREQHQVTHHTFTPNDDQPILVDPVLVDTGTAPPPLPSIPQSSVTEQAQGPVPEEPVEATQEQLSARRILKPRTRRSRDQNSPSFAPDLSLPPTHTVGLSQDPEKPLPSVQEEQQQNPLYDPEAQRLLLLADAMGFTCGSSSAQLEKSTAGPSTDNGQAQPSSHAPALDMGGLMIPQASPQPAAERPTTRPARATANPDNDYERAAIRELHRKLPGPEHVPAVNVGGFMIPGGNQITASPTEMEAPQTPKSRPAPAGSSKTSEEWKQREFEKLQRQALARRGKKPQLFQQPRRTPKPASTTSSPRLREGSASADPTTPMKIGEEGESTEETAQRVLGMPGAKKKSIEIVSSASMIEQLRRRGSHSEGEA
ncbi:hypothetical protein FZEAL_8910 [Fusarium zealandicum]|uniref:Uncharacterized protein n=1 Tax=Fusarium zealandicum TaxID=1053134 RepID=A0A8H4XH12_9HYPO|nr:hypothetical protein FZEAL_8910 [Fusarium zealandicum]